MTGVATAIGAAAVVGAGATVYASGQASKATQNATNASISEQQQALQSQQALAAPYVKAGTTTLPQLESLLGINPNGGAASPAAAASAEATLSQMPGYQFALQQGLTSTKNAAAASGMPISGNTLQALDTFSTGLADQTYNTKVGQLENLVNSGQSAAAGQAANVGNAASNISSSLINQGNTTAGIDANEIAGITKATGNAANQYTTANTLAQIYGNPATPPPQPVAAATVTNPGNWDGSIP